MTLLKFFQQKKKTEMEVMVSIAPKLKLNFLFSFHKTLWEEDPLLLHSNRNVGYIQTLVGKFLKEYIPNEGIENLIYVKDELFRYLDTHLHEKIDKDFELVEITILFL